MGTERKQSIFQQALERVIKLLDEAGPPWPTKPKGFGESYEFPQDMVKLSSTKLSQLQSRLAAWDGYTTFLLGRADINLSLMQNSYDIALGEKMSELQSNGSSRKLKDTLKAQALSEESELKRATYVLAEKKALVTLLKAQRSIYDTQRHAASREQSRRSDELRAPRTT